MAIESPEVVQEFAFTTVHFDNGAVGECTRSTQTYRTLRAALEVPANVVPPTWRLRYFEPLPGWRVLVCNHPRSSAVVCVAAHPETFDSARVGAVILWGAGREAERENMQAENEKRAEGRASARANLAQARATDASAQLSLF